MPHLIAAASLVCGACDKQQADPSFDARVERPAYATGAGPRILFDEGHKNFHTTEGRYKPFADLIRADGYRLAATNDRFTPELLAEHDILIIANALGGDWILNRDAGRLAFTDAECDVIRDWVERGGALLLVTDHYPTGLAVRNLAKRLGVHMSEGTTGHYVFTPEAGLAKDHPIMRGRNDAEQVRRIRTYTGQSLSGHGQAAALLTLPDDAQESVPDRLDPLSGTLREGPAVYPDQAIAMEVGAGRVVVLGEAAMLSAQVRRGQPVGMNQPGLDNRQFALNVMHWLSRLLPAE